MSKRIEMEGKKFGMLTVKSYSHTNERRSLFWNCICECGNLKVIEGSKLREGSVISCGCQKINRMIKLNKTIHKKHGLSYSRLNNILAMMKQRCYNHNAPNYNDYGGRGIRICEEWLSSLKSFVEWAELNGYDENLTIERVNVDGDYCPENCKWITIQDQQWNKRNTTHITIDGNTKTIKEWADEYNLKPYNIRYRISMGYSGKDLIKPVVNRKADKQSGEMYVKWNDHDNRWIVVIKGKYIGGSVDLNRAIEIKNEYLERMID